MSPVANDFIAIVPSELEKVELADGSLVDVHGQGLVILSGPRGLVRMVEVQFVPALSSRLVSVSKVFDRGGNVDFGGTEVLIYAAGVRDPVLLAPRAGSGWVLDAEIVSSALPSTKPLNAACLFCSGKGKAAAVQGAGDADLRAPWHVWHQRVGHASPQLLRRMAEQGLVSGLELCGDVPERHDCAACLEGKMHNLPFRKGQRKGKATTPFQRIHMDLMGKV